VSVHNPSPVHKGKDGTVSLCGAAGIVTASGSGAGVLERALKAWEKPQTMIFKKR